MRYRLGQKIVESVDAELESRVPCARRVADLWLNLTVGIVKTADLILTNQYLETSTSRFAYARYTLAQSNVHINRD